MLGPLAIEERVLIVMAGRGRRFPWATPELRFHEEYHLVPLFTVEETKEQLARYHPELQALGDIEKIYELSHGVPQINSLLARRPELRMSSIESYNAIIDQQLSFVVKEDERNDTRKHLEALCILNAFDDDRIVALTDAYAKTKRGQRVGAQENISLSQCVGIRRDLVYKALARYDTGKGAYVMDQYIQFACQAYLRSLESPPTTWCSLHQTAQKLYREWENKYSDNGDKWRAEAAAHHRALLGSNC